MENLRNALNELQSKTIGIARIYNHIEMVVEDNEYSFKTITMGNLGGMGENYYPKPDFNFVKIPEKYGNLRTLMNEPFEFSNWYNDNNLNK